MAGLGGGHAPFRSAPPPPVGPWPEALLEVRRGRLGTERALADAVARIGHLERTVEGQLAEIDTVRRELRAAHAAIERMRASTSWRLTAPLRSVLGAPD